MDLSGYTIVIVSDVYFSNFRELHYNKISFLLEFTQIDILDILSSSSETS